MRIYCIYILHKVLLISFRGAPKRVHLATNGVYYTTRVRETIICICNLVYVFSKEENKRHLNVPYENTANKESDANSIVCL